MATTQKRLIEMLSPSKSGAGYTTQYLNEWELKHVTEDAWIHCYHKPYANDWSEAKKLAHDRMKKEGLLPDQVNVDSSAKKVMPTFTESRQKMNKAKEQMDKKGENKMSAKKDIKTNEFTVTQFVTYEGKKEISYIVVRGVHSKELATEIANKRFFKMSKAKVSECLEAIDVWILKDDLYLSRPNMSAKKEIAVIRKKKESK